MEDDEISESERMQIEHIRMLELEQLQVEEIDEEEQSDEDDYLYSIGPSETGEYSYDTSLVGLHSYLGDVDDTHNKMAFLGGGDVLTLPLIFLSGVVLFPEATLPLRIVKPYFVAGFERAMKQVDAPYTIGVIRSYWNSSIRRTSLSSIGTTAEIQQFRRVEDGSVNVVARGQQRFRLKKVTSDVDNAMCGLVQIIEEDHPSRTPREAVGKLAPLRHALQVKPLSMIEPGHPSCDEGNDYDAMSEGSFEGELSSAERRLHLSVIASSYSSDIYGEPINSDDEKFHQHAKVHMERSPLEDYTRSIQLNYNKENSETSSRVEKTGLPDCTCYKLGFERYSIRHLRDVPRAFWPSWVYRMYDPYVLARKAADRWNQVVKAPNLDNLVRKPDQLSFHIASKIPISESTRQELLEIDGTSYRLRREIELLESFDKLLCKTCETHIANRSDMLVMSSDGPLGAFANPQGHVHEVMTIYKTDGIAVTGPPVKEFSWFPGYAWSVGECITCGSQMGWYFSATKKKLRPQAFWGIRSSQITDDTH